MHPLLSLGGILLACQIVQGCYLVTFNGSKVVKYGMFYLMFAVSECPLMQYLAQHALEEHRPTLGQVGRAYIDVLDGAEMVLEGVVGMLRRVHHDAWVSTRGIKTHAMMHTTRK